MSNVLVIMVDEMRADVAYHERYPFVRMPNLDELRRQGVTFTEAFCQTPTCVPSRASYTTGLYPHQIGVVNHSCKIPEHVQTWGHNCTTAGLETPCFGKTHGMHPGFSSHVGPGYKVETLGTSNTGNHPFSETITGRFAGQEDDYYEFAVARDVCQWLRDRDQSKSFAAHVGFLAPHPPFYPPQRFIDMYDDDAFDLPELDAHAWRGKPLMQRNKSLNQYLCHEPDIRRRIVARYASLCTLVDEAMGRILHTLEETGQAEDTMVIFTSDHGDQLGDHGMMGKFWNFYEGSLRIPLVIRQPTGTKNIKAKRSLPCLTEMIDIRPTIHAATGVAADRALPGKDLGTLIKQGTGNNPYPQQTFRPYTYAMTENGRMLRDHRWKLCQYSNDQGELYDLATDPQERCNLFEEDACRPIRQRMTEALLAHIIDHPAIAG